jgi:hypothetical protein
VFYELIFENGDNSIMSADSDEEALEGIKAAHQRAINGQKSLSSDPNSPPAARIKRVMVYKEHPNEYHPDGMIPEKEANEALKAHLDSGNVDVNQLVASLRGLIDPLVNNPAPHESKFQVKETRELNEKEWASV